MADATTVLSAELSANPQPLIEGFKRADAATGAWADAAKRHIQTTQATFGDLKFDVVTTKAKAEQVKLIELQHQLDVARAAGETKTVAALTQEIDLLQTIRRLRSAGLNDNDAGNAARGAAGAVAAAREAAEVRELAAKKRERTIGNPTEAVANAFGRVRLGVLEEGGAKLPVFGSSLEALGAAGIAAAAGLAAVAIAGEEAKKSLEFADDIDRTSKSLGISTTQLQEFDYAFSGSSVGIAQGREALASFNEVFGKYSAGLASGKSAKFLNALGFTPESAREIGDTQEALEKTLTALAKIQNPQQRAALATQLGLKDFLVVLAEGQEGVEKFVKSLQDAQGAGAVISPDEIKRAAELNDKLEQVEHTVSVELKKAFIDLGPVILAAAQLVERLVNGIEQTVEGFRGIAHYDRQKVGEAANEELGFRSAVYNTGLAGKIDAKGRATGGVLSFAYNTHQDNLDQLNARRDALDKLDKETSPTGRPGADLSTAKAARAKAAPQDQTASFDKAAVDAYQSSLKALDTAVAALTGDIDAHGELEKQAVRDDLTKKLADLDAQEVKIRASKVDAHQRDQILQIELAKSSEKIAALARQELIDRQTAQALREQALQRARESASYDADLSTAQAAVTPGNLHRADVSLENFKRQQQLADEAQRNTLQARLDDPSQNYGQSDYDADLAKGRATRAAQLVAQRDSTIRGADPLYNLGHPLTSINDDLHSAEADGVKSLGDGLASIVTGTKDVKTAFSDMAQSIIADLIKIAIQRSIEAPLANLLFGGSAGNIGAVGASASVDEFAGLTKLFSNLPGYASGGVVGGSGGPRSDSILARLSPGEMVLSNDTLDGIARLTPSSVSSPSTVNHYISIDLSGANGDDAINAAAVSAARAAYAQAVSHTDSRFSAVARRQRYSRP